MQRVGECQKRRREGAWRCSGAKYFKKKGTTGCVRHHWDLIDVSSITLGLESHMASLGFSPHHSLESGGGDGMCVCLCMSVC